MARFKKHNEGMLNESKYDYYRRTKDHHRCLFTDREGYRCSKGASILTTVLTCKRVSKDGEDVDPIKGGYCSYHKVIVMDKSQPEGPSPVMVAEHLWQDLLTGRFNPDGPAIDDKPTDWCELAMDKWLDDHKDDALVKRAWLLADGKGDDMDLSEHLQDLSVMLKEAIKPLPYDKSRREPEMVTVNGIPNIAPWNVPENFRHLKRIPKHIHP